MLALHGVCLGWLVGARGLIREAETFQVRRARQIKANTGSHRTAGGPPSLPLGLTDAWAASDAAAGLPGTGQRAPCLTKLPVAHGSARRHRAVGEKRCERRHAMSKA